MESSESQDINCTVCYQTIPLGSLNSCQFPLDFDSVFFNDNFLKFLTLVDTSPYIHMFDNSTSSFCYKCMDNLGDINATLKEIEELQRKLSGLKSEFESNLVKGFESSRSKLKLLPPGSPKVDQSQPSPESELTLDKFYEARCRLVRELKLVPEYKKEIQFAEYCQVDVGAFSPAAAAAAEEAEGDLDQGIEKKPDPIEALKNSRREDDIEDDTPNVEESISRREQPKRKYSKRKRNKEFLYCTFQDCQFKTKLDERMKTHIRKDHLKERTSSPREPRERRPDLECNICGAVKKRRADLDAHLRSHSGEKCFFCEICGKSYYARKSLTQHMKSHMDRPKQFKCSLCDRAYVSQFKLNAHFKVHTGENKVICDICGRQFSNRTILDGHKNKEHYGLGFSCTICSKSFVTKYSLDDHLKIHFGTQKFQCPECPTRHNSNTALKIHISLIHRKEKNFVCHQCPKRYGLESHLRVHLRTHSGEKPHSCSICHRSFTRLETMKNHEKTHDKSVTPFHCEYCGKGFLLRDYLRQHYQRTKCAGAVEHVKNNKFRLRRAQMEDIPEGSTHLTSAMSNDGNDFV